MFSSWTVEITVAAHDTTGGMATKISEAAMIARQGVDVYIVKVMDYGCFNLRTSAHKNFHLYLQTFEWILYLGGVLLEKTRLNLLRTNILTGAGSHKSLHNCLEWKVERRYSRRLARNSHKICQITYIGEVKRDPIISDFWFMLTVGRGYFWFQMAVWNTFQKCNLQIWLEIETTSSPVLILQLLES